MLALVLALLPSEVLVSPGESIQAAIDAAVDGDTILVAPGTYTENLDYRGKAIAVVSTDGPRVTTLMAPGSSAAPLVQFRTAEGPDSLLQGFTLTNAARGIEAVDRQGSFPFPNTPTSPTIRDCVITDLRPRRYELGFAVAGNPTLARCVISNGPPLGYTPSAIAGQPTLRSCVVARFSSYDAGPALYIVPWSPTPSQSTIEDTVFLENGSYDSASGGAVHITAGGTAVFRRCLFIRNAAHNTLLRNSGLGTALHAIPGTSVRLENCTITEGEGSLPGIIWHTPASAVYGPIELLNCIVRLGNEDLALDAGATATWSNIEGGAPGIGNLDRAPRFVDPNSDDYHLAPGSPCSGSGLAGSDMGAFPYATLYPRTWPTLSARYGGTISLRLLTPQQKAGSLQPPARRLYWTLHSPLAPSPLRWGRAHGLDDLNLAIPPDSGLPSTLSLAVRLWRGLSPPVFESSAGVVVLSLQ